MGWLEINTDVTARKRAEQAARSLSGRILTLQDDERRRIAQGLHDSLGQYLTALKINLDQLSAFDNGNAALVDGFSRRSDIKVNLNISPTLDRRHRDVEVALLRCTRRSHECSQAFGLFGGGRFPECEHKALRLQIKDDEFRFRPADISLAGRTNRSAPYQPSLGSALLSVRLEKDFIYESFVTGWRCVLRSARFECMHLPGVKRLRHFQEQIGHRF